MQYLDANTFKKDLCPWLEIYKNFVFVYYKFYTYKNQCCYAIKFSSAN